jgi:hypothetical protein
LFTRPSSLQAEATAGHPQHPRIGTPNARHCGQMSALLTPTARSRFKSRASVTLLDVINLLHEAAAPETNGASRTTPLELLALGVLCAALGISALMFRARLWEVYQGMSRPMGPIMARFQYFISCLLVPAIFAVFGIVALVLGLVRI